MQTDNNQSLQLYSLPRDIPQASLDSSDRASELASRQHIRSSLDQMFQEQEFEEKSIKTAKAILGGTADKFSSDQLQTMVSEVQFLVESWLDDYERSLFDGITLNELLHDPRNV